MRYFVVVYMLSSLFIIRNGYSQQMTPPIQNYTTIEYDAASQNWDLTIDKQGIFYAANHQGLLSYDGQRWEFFPLESQSIIRSVYAHEGKIYTGSYQEFGYWSRDAMGKMNYTSLTPLLEGQNFKSEEFWEIISYKDAIYFRSFGTIYKYEDESIELVRDGIINGMFVYKDRLLLAVGKSGLFFLNEDNSLQPLPYQEALKGKTIVDMDVQGDSLLIGTRKALYIFDGEKCVLFNDEDLNEDIEKYELNRIMSISPHEVVFGTIKNGIIHYNNRTKEHKIYNRNDGLQNNTVLGMVEKDGEVWLGLDNGIDKMDFNSAFSFFTDDSGELGAVYDLALFNNNLFLASNTGIYTIKDEELILIDGAEGHTWNLEILDNTLYANHNRGTYRIEKEEFVPIDEHTGSFGIQSVPKKDDFYFLATYTGLRSFSKDGTAVSSIEGSNFPVEQLVFEDPHTLWAAHPYEGIYRIGLNENLTETTFVKKVENFNGKDHYQTDIFQINNQIAVFSKNSWYKYNPFLDTLEPFEELGDFSNHRLLLQDNKGFWFCNKTNNSLVFTDFQDRNFVIPAEKLNRRLVKDNENIIRGNDSIYYVTLNDGFAKIEMNELKELQQEVFLEKPILRGFMDIKGRYDLSTVPSIPNELAKNISILAALPTSLPVNLRYQLIHDEVDTLYGTVNNGKLGFQNLKEGTYQLNLFALGPQNISSAMTSFKFGIEPPWYLSNSMKVFYFLLLLGIAALLHWSHQTRMKNQQKVLEGKFEMEHQDRLNELEKERLKDEISLKRKELANSTMIAAKKNEVLLEIQAELNKDKNKFSNQFRIKHIMNKINRAVKDTDEWKVFETNFTELHEDFFRLLLDSYPNMSSKDLKLCAYLKMNLSSKEIAPLMAISLRGVEVHRYRLRKKMGLDKKINLNHFLIKNF